MPIKYYLDTHIAKAVAVQLRNKTIEVVRCEEVNMAEASDKAHLEYAAANGYTMVSHDIDFIILHAEWLYAERAHAGIVVFAEKFQGNIGKIVTELYTLYTLIQEGAGTLERDIHNKLHEIKE